MKECEVRDIDRPLCVADLHRIDLVINLSAQKCLTIMSDEWQRCFPV